MTETQPSSPINIPTTTTRSFWNEELFSELLLHEAGRVYAQRIVDGCETDSPSSPRVFTKKKRVPAPLLVGIELNPGPTPGSMAVGEIGALLGSLLASSTKKKKNTNKKIAKTKKKKTPTTNNLNVSAKSMRSLSAPIVRSVSTRPAGVTHKPFLVTGCSYMGQVSTNATGLGVLSNADGTLSTTSVANIDPRGSGTVVNNFALFPGTVRNIAGSFMKYRVRKLVISYCPLVSATVPGSLAMTVLKEGITNSGGYSYAPLLSTEACCTSPVWSPYEMDFTKYINNDWLWLENTVTLDQAALRQETPAAFAVGVAGAPFSTFLGTFMCHFEIEFDAIANESSFVSSKLPSDSSSSSPTAPSIRIDEDLSDSIYISAESLAKMRIKREL